MPQATRSNDHHTYRCYLRGPDGFRGLSLCGPGALIKLPLPRFWSQGEHPENPNKTEGFLPLLRPAPEGISETRKPYPSLQASGTCVTQGDPPPDHSTDMASNRIMVPAGRCRPRSQSLATRAISLCFAKVIASKGWPWELPLRDFTSTKARIPSFWAMRSTSLRPERMFRPRMVQPRASKNRAALSSPRRPVRTLSNPAPPPRVCDKERSQKGMGETRVRRECRTLVSDEPKGVAVRLQLGTGLQHWASTLGFNTGLQHRASTPGFNTGLQPGFNRASTPGFNAGLQVSTEGASSRLIALAISRIWSTSPLN